MALKLYNTLNRKKEVFKPLKDKEAGMYTCGPTVYFYAHIGNLRTYVFEDILKRVLLYNKFKVEHVMNITDVGHLTSDADEGEDKMLKGAKREGKTVWEIAEYYTKAFKEDLKELNILEPDVWCKATDHIKDMINLIKRLEEKGFTYSAEGNIYFDVSKFKNYGKMARLNLENLQAGARIKIDPNKKNPQDFVLWFTKSKFDNQEMKWDSPWGLGYPGWHIECSAMSMRYLGEQFDIHCGGIDHIPVHHTNEIAQSEGATGKKWVSYWLHGEFLQIDNGKMAKSTGKISTINNLKEKGYEPLSFRYLCLGTHYRKQLTFSFEALDGAQIAYNKLKNKILELKDNLESRNADKKEFYEKEFLNHINDDLNIPRGLALVWDLLKDKDLGNKEKYDLILYFDKVFGIRLDEVKEEKIKLTPEEKKLIDEREEARKEKDFVKADRIRNELKDKGIILEDAKDGVRWKRESNASNI